MEKLLKSFSTKKSLEKYSKNKEIILSENFEKEMNDWKLPDVTKSKVYKKGSFQFKSDYVVITQEQSIPLKEGFDTCKLLENSMIQEHKKNYLFLHLGMVQVGIKPMSREGLNISALITVRDNRHLQFEDSLLGIVESSLAEGPIYFSCCPNFTVALEDAESFSWLFEKFVECMGSVPSLIITDQDLGMKAAIERVLVGTRHRWCMWHIMLKAADKISKDLQANEEFKKELNHYVWSELIDPEAFEAGWAAIMMKYGLVDDDWFKSMFQARSYWVPAFFRDFPMNGLLRTTSISESENSFYKRYTRSRNNLLECWMSFNHALDEQRHAFSHANYLDTSVIPTLQTRWLLEKQTAVMYSGNMMADVQEEISSACNSCAMLDINNKELVVEYSVKDEFGCTFNVVYTIEEDAFACGCKLFLRKGILCRHIFLVFKNKEMKNIPEKYIIGRWRKVADVTPVHDAQITELER